MATIWRGTFWAHMYMSVYFICFFLTRFSFTEEKTDINFCTLLWLAFTQGMRAANGLLKDCHLAQAPAGYSFLFFVTNKIKAKTIIKLITIKFNQFPSKCSRGSVSHPVLDVSGYRMIMRRNSKKWALADCFPQWRRTDISTLRKTQKQRRNSLDEE